MNNLLKMKIIIEQLVRNARLLPIDNLRKIVHQLPNMRSLDNNQLRINKFRQYPFQLKSLNKIKIFVGLIKRLRNNSIPLKSNLLQLKCCINLNQNL